MGNIISVKSLCKSYGKKEVLNSIDLNIPEGKVTGYIGPNGAGKTTTLNILTGLLYSDKGDIRYWDMPFDPNQNHIKKKIGYVPENQILYPNLTVHEQMVLHGRLYKMSKDDIKKRMLSLMEEFDLGQYSHSLISQLSKGNRQKALIACAMLHSPEILFLDEPMSGLDIHMQRSLKKMINSHIEGGGTLIYSSHIIEVVQKLVEHLIVIDEGSIKYAGTVDGFLKKNSVTDLEEALLRTLNG
ncbi:ABC transporter ATP-binding protein [bacterium]|nr:ABC transporter ATP-binding protein [bacterium]